MKCNSSNELNNNSIIIDEASVSDSEFINELQNIATISNNENFAKTTDDCMLINQFTVDENNLIKSSEPIAISKKLLENNLITSPVILEDDLHTESLINENSNTGIPSDKTSIKDNAILSETSNNNDLLGNNNFKLNLSVNKREKSSSSEKLPLLSYRHILILMPTLFPHIQFFHDCLFMSKKKIQDKKRESVRKDFRLLQLVLNREHGTQKI
ncbi:uncharacterized protein LOC143376062 isoform X4 [Andrena cerasifolii]|uniref:uncharacterized protein LOC143376062 isoform X4 n=1 Tax=Andrena cerasifolii TaxID=2819439 RepID=UPI0040384501